MAQITMDLTFRQWHNMNKYALIDKTNTVTNVTLAETSLVSVLQKNHAKVIDVTFMKDQPTVGMLMINETTFINSIRTGIIPNPYPSHLKNGTLIAMTPFKLKTSGLTVQFIDNVFNIGCRYYNPLWLLHVSDLVLNKKLTSVDGTVTGTNGGFIEDNFFVTTEEVQQIHEALINLKLF